MENASKALIIAGAILISILLISVGIIVMNSINDPLNQAEDEAKQQAIQMFNSKFTGYSGTQKAAGVKALMTAVQSSSGAATSHPILVKKGKTATNVAVSSAGEVQSLVKSTGEYTVTIEDKGDKQTGTGNSANIKGTPDGYIDTITVVSSSF